jgi:hypothetical protein
MYINKIFDEKNQPITGICCQWQDTLRMTVLCILKPLFFVENSVVKSPPNSNCQIVASKPKKKDNKRIRMKFLPHKDKERKEKPSPQKQECGCPSLQTYLSSRTHKFFSDPNIDKLLRPINSMLSLIEIIKCKNMKFKLRHWIIGISATTIIAVLGTLWFGYQKKKTTYRLSLLDK